MPAAKRKTDFYTTEEGELIKSQLYAMAADVTYMTESSYSTDSSTYNDHRIPFVDKHMRYLVDHPAVNPAHYLANLRLMTRVR